MDNERMVYTPQEVADRLGVSLRLVYRQLRKGLVPHVKVGDKYLISRHAFEKWIDGNC